MGAMVPNEDGENHRFLSSFMAGFFVRHLASGILSHCPRLSSDASFRLPDGWDIIMPGVFIVIGMHW